jgi:hypothetical protein
MPLKTLFCNTLLGCLSLISPAIAHEHPYSLGQELPEIPYELPTPTKIEYSPKIPLRSPKKLLKTTKVEDTPKFPVNPQEIKVTKAEFGVFRQDKYGKIKFIPTKKVPLQEGLVYGWQLQIKNYEGSLVWKEIFKLPRLPLTWVNQNGYNFSLSHDGTAAITEKIAEVKKGVVNNSWTVTLGDPPGKHLIEVYIASHHVASFEFEVVKPNRKINTRGRNKVIKHFFKNKQTSAVDKQTSAVICNKLPYSINCPQ